MQEEIQAILEKAVSAPSGDNSQPWEFAFRGDSTIDIFLIPHKDNPILNYKLSGSYIAHGALIENIAILAEAHGLHAAIQALPDPSDPLVTARVTFEKAVKQEDPLADAVTERHTNRKQYKKEPLSANAVTVLKEASAQSEASNQSQFRIILDPQLIQKAGHAEATIQKVALETPSLHKLFFSNILWKEEHNTGEHQGLYIKSMELPPPVATLFPVLSKWPVTNAFNKIGFSKMASKTNGELFASSPAIGLVSVRSEEPKEYIAAGRVFQRIWLAATVQDLSFQPISGLLFISRRIADGETTNELLPKHFNEIENAAKEIREAFSLSDTEIPMMMFRMGYSDTATARSKRRKPIYRI